MLVKNNYFSSLFKYFFIRVVDISFVLSKTIVGFVISLWFLKNESIGIYTEPVLDIKADNPYQKVNLEDGMWMYPEEIYLARTNEWTETNNLIPMMSGRSSLGRNGLHVHCSAGMGSIGYKGYWHMGIRPTKPIWIVKDLKCCQIYYYTVEGEIDNTYNGLMQNIPKEELGSQMHRILQKKR